MDDQHPESLGIDTAAPRRVRLSMLGVLALIALVVGFQAWQAYQAEELRSTDAEIIALAGAQRWYSQRLTLLVMQTASDSVQVALDQSLGDARVQGQRLEQLLASLDAQDGDHESAGLLQAGRAWAGARDQFLDGVAKFGQAGTQLDMAQRTEALRAVQARADDFLRHSVLLAEQAQLLAQAHSRSAARSLLASTGLVVALIVLLALGVVEPTARFVRRQVELLQRQATEVQRLALVARHTANAVLILDTQRRVEWVNPGFTRLTGLGLDEVEGKTLAAVLRLEHSDPQMLADYRDRLSRGQEVQGELMVRSSGGRDFWATVDAQPLRGAAGKVTGWIVVAVDIDDQVRQRQQRRALFEALPTGVLVYARNGDVVDCNRAAMEMMGLGRDQAANYSAMYEALGRSGRPVRDDLSDYPEAERPVQRTLRHGMGLRGESMGFLRAPDDVSWVMVNTEPLLDDQGAIQGAVACFVDVSRQKMLEQTLRDSSRTDGLTLLPNRVVVTDRIRAALERHQAQPGYHFAVLFMDFDRFKQVNDTLGHGVGDELLRQIAARLQTSLRPSDAFVRTSDFGQLAARIGGDEFVVLLDDIRGDLDAEVVAGRLLDVLAVPYEIGPHVVSSSVSIGIVTATHTTSDVEAVLRDADIAMYEAKRTGRGRYVMFEPAMHRRVRDDVSLENDLRQALVRQELFVVYQPIVDLVSRAVTGMEALVRWRHPRRGLVSPVEFIPVAEAVGLIARLGAYVLDTACAGFAAMQDSLGPLAPRTVSVNLSRAQLREPVLVSDLLDALRAHGMNPSQLQLEITESLAVQDQAMQSKLQEIKALGVTLALDDFGTGYSSLSCLHTLPVGTVKIDRAFVSTAQSSDYHRVLIEATILMAETLGMGTVAEGIETQEQAELMRALGCDKGQGYLYSQPLERDDLVRWIRSAPHAGGV